MWVVIFCALIIFISWLFKSPKRFPPGPPSLPLVGNIFSIWFRLKQLKLHHHVWQEWSTRYGEVLGLRLGLVNLVIVFGREKIKEVSSRDDFDGRPNGFFYLLRSFGKKIGIVFSDGPSWLATRKVVLKFLKNFGYGTRSMETIIGHECRELVRLRMEDAGRPVSIDGMFHVSIANVLWRIVAGKRYDLKDECINRICGLITRSFKVVDMSGGLINFLPWLRHLCPDLTGYRELREIHDELFAYLKETINEHSNSIDLNNPRDVIDAFLIEAIENKDRAFSEEELQVVCLDLLEAGMETVSNTLAFLMLHVLLNNDVQHKLHQEIDEMVGFDKTPTLADRSRMTYSEAVVMEVLRISTVAAVGIPHMAVRDAQLGDYVIPKGTFVLLAYHDLHNGGHWKNPKIFQPERFLTKEGNIIQEDWLMPFGNGRRKCIGENLARSELFLFLTHILQKFNLRLPEGDPNPSTEAVDGVSLSTQPFRIVFEPRFK